MLPAMFTVALSLGVGPVIDPIEGSHIDSSARRALPSGRHLGSIVDLWLPTAVGQQITGGGIAAFDPLAVSSHGRSFTLQRHLVGLIDITDPARPGEPLVQMPHGAWDGLHHHSLWTSTPGYEWSFAPAPLPSASVWAGFGTDIGGGTWIPKGLMNREPGLPGGPADARRDLRDARELTGDATLHTASGIAVRVFAEHAEHEHTYPTLLDGVGERIADTGSRSTVLAAATARLAGLPWHGLMGWQGRRRSHGGAQFTFAEPMTLRGDADALMGQVGTEISLVRARLSIAAGAAYRTDDTHPRGEAPFVSDIEREWTWLARPRPGELLRRLRADVVAVARVGERRREPLSLRMAVSHAAMHSTPRIPSQRVGRSYLRDSEGDTAVSQTVYEGLGRTREWLRSVQLGAEYELGSVNTSRLVLHAGVDHGAAGAHGTSALQVVTPTVGAVATARVSPSHELFGLVRAEPQRLTAEVSSFLNPGRPSGSIFAWNDDGDAVPEPGERGALLGRTGGRYHDSAPGLKRPVGWQMALGWRGFALGPFRALFMGVGRFLLNRYTVRLADESMYEARTFHDPGGDGRGEIRAPSGGQDLTVYARRPGGEAAERFVLTNAKRADFYLGLEAQLLTIRRRPWFVNLGGAAYLSAGSAPFGSFPDRNDPGIIDEASADPNQRRQQRGRYDHDRAFGLNLMGGVAPIEGFEAALAVRYRDGQPFTRVVVADLPQGPVPIMAVRRGKPRHTFHMTVDARVRYELVMRASRAALVLDVYNLLGSGTEYHEDPRTGLMYRDVMEMVPGRAAFLSFEMAWRRPPGPQ